MEFLLRYTKLLNVLYNTVFSPSDGGVDDVLMKLSLIKQIIMDVNLTCLSFSVKHPHIF